MQRSKTIRRTIPAAFLLVALAACAGTAPTSKGTSVDTAAANGAAAVPELLQFTAPLVGGGEFVGSDYAGRATAFWFWAPN